MNPAGTLGLLASTATTVSLYINVSIEFSSQKKLCQLRICLVKVTCNTFCPLKPCVSLVFLHFSGQHATANISNKQTKGSIAWCFLEPLNLVLRDHEASTRHLLPLGFSLLSDCLTNPACCPQRLEYKYLFYISSRYCFSLHICSVLLCNKIVVVSLLLCCWIDTTITDS